MSSSPSLQHSVGDYLRWEPRAEARAAVQALLDAKEEKALQAAFEPRIAFGTAGLRARMAPGYHNINDLVILQTTQGFARYLEAQAGAQAEQWKEAGVVLGYDGRHNSRRYAELAALTFLRAGFRVHLFSRMVCTPFVPYALLLLKACAGVMVTASHNPKDDNGYKVYWGNGAQIISPHDHGIAASILQNLQPWHLAESASAEPSEPVFDANHPRLSDPFEKVNEAYFRQARELYCWTDAQNRALKQSDCPVTFTAMHGVGTPFTAAAFEAFGLPPFVPTASQAAADPEFPTVAFPNPEEGKGALKLAMEAADAANSKLIIANDPDADRMAVAEKVEVNGEMVWKPLNGNQIALLLADWVFQQYVSRSKPSSEQLSKCVMISSTVSSAILGAMARKEGFQFFPTLTGFKWMGNRARQAVDDGLNFLFAFEVEIGFLVGNMSYDKDGVRTAAVFYELYAELCRQGLSCHAKLEQLYARYGYYNMNTSYFFCAPGSGKMEAVFERLRNFPGTDGAAYANTQHRYPTSVGGVAVTSVRDVTYGYDNSESDFRSQLPIDKSASMLTFRFANGCTATLRNSGTEPKLKYYVECNAASAAEAAALTEKMTKAIIGELIQPEHNGLEAPKVVA